MINQVLWTILVTSKSSIHNALWSQLCTVPCMFKHRHVAKDTCTLLVDHLSSLNEATCYNSVQQPVVSPLSACCRWLVFLPCPLRRCWVGYCWDFASTRRAPGNRLQQLTNHWSIWLDLSAMAMLSLQTQSCHLQLPVTQTRVQERPWWNTNSN